VIIDLHTHTQEYSSCSHLPMEELIHRAMAVGLDGVAVTDHSRIGGAEGALDWCPELQWLSAMEVFNGHCDDGESSQARRLARTLGLPGVGGSDAHFAPEVGIAATLFPDPISTDEELIAALRAGYCSPRRWIADSWK